MSANILWQLQLSAYDTYGKFILTADSNWQVFVIKMRQMIKVDPNIHATIVMPYRDKCIEDVDVLLEEHGLTKNVDVVRIMIRANALITRYDFPWAMICDTLGDRLKHFTHAYINDPMLLRHYKAMFHIAKVNPKVITQVHFLDSPLSPVVDSDVSYWHGTVEALLKSDVCLWHCVSMLDVIHRALVQDYAPHIVKSIIDKGIVWKSGYSIEEIRKPVDTSKVRFDIEKLNGKLVVWVPNRVGGLGRSLDYTNNGQFLFDIVPRLWKHRTDFVVLAGNPSQKISNDEIAGLCPAYVKLVDGPVNRDEYRLLSSRADIVVGLYTNDTNGGLASLESIEFGAAPLFTDVYEYKTYFDSIAWPTELRVNEDLSDTHKVLCRLIDDVRRGDVTSKVSALQDHIRRFTSVEQTTPMMMKRLGFV